MELLWTRSESHSKESSKEIVECNMTKTSGSSSRSSDSKRRALEEKARLAEPASEEAFLVEQYMADNEAKKIEDSAKGCES